MGKPNNYTLSTLAESDLQAIFRDSLSQWGIQQTQKYADLLESTLRQLATHPGIGKNRDELLKGTLSFPCGSHLIFYRASVHGIDIARVLHKRMDADGQLG